MADELVVPKDLMQDWQMIIDRITELKASSRGQLEEDALRTVGQMKYYIERLSRSEQAIASWKNDEIIWKETEKRLLLQAQQMQAGAEELIEENANLQAKLEDKERLFTEHTQAVGRFLSDMYATMICPLDDGDDRKVSEMCELLLHAASENRQALQDQMDRAGNLPANWKEDSSLETWFPLTSEELQRLRTENAELERKGKELCSAYGNSLITIHDLEKVNAALKMSVTVFETVFRLLACPDDNPRELAERTLQALERPDCNIDFGFTYDTEGKDVEFTCVLASRSQQAPATPEEK